MDVQAFVRPLEQIEAGMQTLYETLATRFAATDPPASAVFCRLAFEERSHMAKLQYLRRLGRQLGSDLAEVKFDRDALDAELGRIEKAVLDAPALSLHEAIATSLEVEYGAGDLHGRLAIAQSNPELAAVLVGLKGEDERHAKRLVALAQDRGGLP
jgi:rubrerythrin